MNRKKIWGQCDRIQPLICTRE